MGYWQPAIGAMYIFYFYFYTIILWRNKYGDDDDGHIQLKTTLPRC